MKARIYATIGYERGRKPGQGYVVRFCRVRDGMGVGAAFWNRKERKFFLTRAFDGHVLDLAQVAEIEARVPSLRCDGSVWYSNNNES